MSKGLTTVEAENRQKKYGLNIISDQKKKIFIVKFFEQLFNFFVVLLIFAAVLSFSTGEIVDGILILTIVLLNALFGLYQENKAEQALSALKKMTISNVRVIRDGQEKEIDSRDLVPGDIFHIEEGVKVPADARIIEAANLEFNESALTGESIPVVKAKGEEIFMGTIVAKGRGKGEVLQIGMNTKFGEIAAKLSTLEESKTPLQKKLEYISEIIGLVGIVISGAVFFLSVIQGSTYISSFLLAISLAVAIVPEGLPAVMTITLAVGVQAMAEKKAIVRKLSAIEALGNITLIATDKTGTLTTNKMEVKEVWFDQKTILLDDLQKEKSETLQKIVHDGILCSTASLVYVHDHGSFDILGDPTEGALLLMAKKLGVEPDVIRNDVKIIDELPFDSVTKRMSVKIKEHEHTIIYTKGSPESILNISTKILINGIEEELSEAKKYEMMKVMDAWAAKGLRVLGFSYSRYSYDTSNILLGLVAIHDPPRLEVEHSIKKAHQAGIQVVMITGDNEKTAEAVGTSIGLVQDGDIILKGEQVEQYTDKELLKLLPKVTIFARVTPLHKSRIVSLYQKLGHIVAVTGDGVNDAIALKQADVGVAMGRVGTDVAREAADMVITDDNFATIVVAVEEGRNIVKNLKNAIKYLLTGNLTEALALLIALSLGFPPIFIPLQLLYINLLSDGVPALALAFSPRSEHTMEKSEQKVDILAVKDILYILFVSVSTATIIIVGYILAAQSGELFQRTVAFTILGVIQPFIFIDLWLSHRSFRGNYHTLKSKIFLAAFFLPIIAQFIINNSSFFTRAFEIQQISNLQFFFLFCIATLAIFTIKGIKKILGYQR